MTEVISKVSSGQPIHLENYSQNRALDPFKTGVDELSRNSTVLSYQMGYYNTMSMA